MAPSRRSCNVSYKTNTNLKENWFWNRVSETPTQETMICYYLMQISYLSGGRND